MNFKVKFTAKAFSTSKLFLIFSLLTLILGGCKKLALLTGSQHALEEYFADNVLNKNFVVDFASDSTIDITAQYTGYNFVLTNTTSYYDGNMTGTKDGVVYSGTWASNTDYSKLIINLSTPTIPNEFIFLNRTWRFTKKDPPLLKLAPWGSNDNKILYMRRL